jgi:hypothetical protein
MEFRGGLARHACRILGTPLPEPITMEHIHSHSSLLHDLPSGLFLRAVEMIAHELATIRFSDLSQICDPHYAEYSVGMILYEIGVMPDQLLIFQEQAAWKILEGSEVGTGRDCRVRA